MRKMKIYWDELANKYKTSIRAVGYENVDEITNTYFDSLFRKAIFKSIEEIMGLDNLRGELILDVGCGFGRWCFEFSSFGAKVKGIDFSEKMIRNAVQLRSQLRNKDINFIVGCANKLPFKANCFDLVISVTVLQHILDEKEFHNAIQEIARIIKPGGYLLLLDETWCTNQVSDSTFARQIKQYEKLFKDEHLYLNYQRGVDVPFGRNFFIKYKLVNLHLRISNLPLLNRYAIHTLMVFKKQVKDITV